MFAVVHFVDDESVECVPKSWLEGQYCYWPHLNAKKKIQKMSLPDKDTWKKYKYRKIGQDYEDYDTARKYLKKAEETSNLESEEESRKRKLPARLISESDNDTDIESDIEGKTLPSLPKNTCSQKEKKRTTPVKKMPTLPSLDSSPLSPSPPASSVPVKKQNLATHSVKRQLLTSTTSIRRSPRSKSTLSALSAGTATPPRSTPSVAIQLPVISKLDKQQQDITAIKNHLISAVDVDLDTIESLLPSGNRLNTSAEVEEFQDSLDDDSKKKLINAMASLQGGEHAGEICRAVMRSIMTNNCMSQFSGTGQKGKIAFIGTPLYKIILSAVRKASKKTIPFETIKREVLDVLRFAPHLPGGINYAKKKRGKKSNPKEGEFPPDSE
ncbi:DNA topoisomerase 2-alpha-like isoform X2 [Crassostrea angulata]|uniref:DNA topoisomerase 2-alpha-like isoform X2 n=1 Tax=Magallana angulata TaxID=2784310 RepID=UPI0022B0D7B1|nr:DNA topoisomerase 2-alpha-like isoform X2 [Crassostrea angulata]